MINKKHFFLVCFTFIFLACQLKVAMASNPNETMNSNSPLVGEWHTVTTWTMTLSTSTISPTPQLPDTPDDNPLDYVQLICSFLLLVGAGTVLAVLAKHKSLCRLPKPVESPNTL
jgi:hypothetical protein